MLDLAFYLRDYSLSANAMLVYGVLDGLSKASAKNGRPYTYISRKSIGQRIGKSERTARRAVKELERVGLIMIKRMGNNLNDHIFVFAPKAQQEEKQSKAANANHSVYMAAQKRTDLAAPTNAKKEIKNNQDSKLSIPENDIDKGRTAPKGRPTKKQTRRSIDERRQIKKRYKDYLIKMLELNEFKNDLFSYGDDIEALEKVIELIANTMASKGKIMVNGALLMPAQWWYVVKNITQDRVINLIVKVGNTPNIRNYRAYMLASLYNAGLTETLQTPAYNRLMERFNEVS